MGFFKKIFSDEAQEEEVFQSEGYQNEGEEDDGFKPKPLFILAKPESRDELPEIAKSLLERKTIILNLELVSGETRRFVDFLSGVAFALNGNTKKVAVNTFLITPGGLDISGDMLEDIENEFFV